MNNMEMSVVKRNGVVEPLQIEKIHKVTAWACEGLNVSQSELETEANLMFFDGIKTSDIHQALIKSASTLISVEAPDYTFVAARLLLQKLYKGVNGGSIEYPSMESYVYKGLHECRLDTKLLTRFRFDDINAAIDPDRDLLFTYLGLQTLVDRYLIRTKQENGNEIIELPQHMWMRVAMGLALREDDPTARAIEFYNVLSKLEFVSSTPTLFNSGTNHSQLSSCYLNTVEDSIDGIYGTIHECANLSKYAGGIGTDWTRVRPAKDPILGTNGQSAGVVPYLKVFNDTAVAVNQCFGPDTLVRTADGAKRISDIQVDDLVLGERGAYRTVREVLSYNQKDPMVSIKIKHSLEPLVVTAGHPILAIQGVAEEQSIERTLRQIETGKKGAMWVEAGQLTKGDYVAQVIPTEIIPQNDFSEDDARLYGIMLGDGHCSVKKMTNARGEEIFAKEWGVTGSSENEETLQFVAKYLTKRGFKYSFVKAGNGCSATQIKWSYGGEQQQRDDFGKFIGAENCLPFDHDDLYDENGKKRISRRFSHLPLPQALSIVRGLIDSDGCVSRGKEITFTNTSRQLVEGLRYQLLRLGVPTAGFKKVRDNIHLGSSAITTSWDVRIPAITELAQALGIPEVTKFNWFRQGNMIFSRVTSVEEIEPLPVVYDLKVDGDHTYSTTSALVHNGGKRNGAFAAYLEPWHPDFFDFCDLKKNSGDERRRAHDIFPAAWIPDLFMKRVKENGIWSFFSPREYPELHELHGEAFERRYEELEREGKARSQMPAMDVWKKILTSLFETGHPWITFKDECNRRNPQDHVGVIHSSNLCVAPETMVLTDQGHIPIVDLAGKKVNVWNGNEFSLVDVVKTGENQEVIKVVLSDGAEIECTPYHKFYVQQGYFGGPIVKRAHELKPEDKLIKFELPYIEGSGEFPHAYTAGFFCGDGTYGRNERPILNLYGDKKELVKHFAIKSGSNVEHANGRLSYTMVDDLPMKFTVPHNYSTKSRLTWLAGLLDSDGTVSRNGSNESLQISSINSSFLNEVRLMLQTLGVASKVTMMRGAEVKIFADGQPAYECQPLYRLLIGSVAVQDLLDLGLETHRLKIFRHTPNRSAKQFVKVLEVVDEGRLTDTYCFTEPKRYMGVFNGVLTGNCTEITLNTSDDETAVCNLGSINLSRIQTLLDFEHVIKTAVRMLDNVIDINFYPSNKAKFSNLRHRPIGLGVMGYTEWLVQRGIDWESEEHIEIANDLFEDLSYYAIEASCDLAAERGAYSTFKGSKWDRGILPIDTARDKGNFLNWNLLREKIQKQGMRNSNVMAIAPTATISNIAGTTPCIEPIYKRTYTEGNLSGSFVVVDPTLRYGHPELCKEAFEISPVWIIKAAAVRQKWIDQSQSVNIFVNAGIKGSQLSEIYMKAWELGLKTTYYLRNQAVTLPQKKKEEAEEVQFCSISSPDCESCQ